MAARSTSLALRAKDEQKRVRGVDSFARRRHPEDEQQVYRTVERYIVHNSWSKADITARPRIETYWQKHPPPPHFHLITITCPIKPRTNTHTFLSRGGLILRYIVVQLRQLLLQLRIVRIPLRRLNIQRQHLQLQLQHLILDLPVLQRRGILSRSICRIDLLVEPAIADFGVLGDDAGVFEALEVGFGDGGEIVGKREGGVDFVESVAGGAVRDLELGVGLLGEGGGLAADGEGKGDGEGEEGEEEGRGGELHGVDGVVAVMGWLVVGGMSVGGVGGRPATGSEEWWWKEGER